MSITLTIIGASKELRAFPVAVTVMVSVAKANVGKVAETAKANKLDPYDYIEFILDYLPQQDLEDPKKLDWFLPWSEEIKEEFEIEAD